MLLKVEYIFIIVGQCIVHCFMRFAHQGWLTDCDTNRKIRKTHLHLSPQLKSDKHTKDRPHCTCTAAQTLGKYGGWVVLRWGVSAGSMGTGADMRGKRERR